MSAKFRWPRFAPRTQGFTLLELLVVMVIIGLLAGYVAPRYFEQVGEGVRPDSIFYNMERMETGGYGGYQKIFERTGKYNGGVPGFDYSGFDY